MPQERAKQEVTRFLGVNLRNDRANLADEDLAKAINADLHSQPGTIVLRLGRGALYTTPLADLVVRRLAKINGIRYQVAGETLYREQVAILTTLSGTHRTSILPYRPLDDTVLWAFIADVGGMKKDDAAGEVTREWGITEPTSAPSLAVAAAGSLTGTFGFAYTFARRDADDNLAHESNASPTASIALAGENATVTGIVDSTDAQVTHKRLYRTAAAGTDYLFDQEIDTGTTTATSSQADTALGDEVEDDNDPPPNLAQIAEFQGHFFGVGDPDNPHYLWFGKRFRPEAFPVANFLEIGNPDDPLRGLAPLAGLLGVFSRATKYRLLGSSTAGFTVSEGLSHRGTIAGQAIVSAEQGIFFVASDGVYNTNLLAHDEEISAAIAPLFNGETVNDLLPINTGAGESMAAALWRRRYYLSVPTGESATPNLMAVWSLDTRRWYFYDHPACALLVEEDADQLAAGLDDGLVYVLESGADDAGAGIALDVETKDYGGGALHTRKLFLWVKLDADTVGAEITVRLYVDGTLNRTVTFTSTRTKPLLAFAEGAMGYTWRADDECRPRRRSRAGAR